jgi:stage V sporulation protein AC
LTLPEGFVTGMAAKMFTVAGPVLTYGITTSALYGLCLQLWSLWQG